MAVPQGVPPGEPAARLGPETPRRSRASDLGRDVESRLVGFELRTLGREIEARLFERVLVHAAFALGVRFQVGAHLRPGHVAERDPPALVESGHHAEGVVDERSVEAGGQARVRLHRPVETVSETVILGTGPEAAPAVVDLLEELGLLP